MTTYQLLRLGMLICKEGDSVLKQFTDFLDGESMDEMNPAALRLIATWLKKAENAGVEDAAQQRQEIEEFLKEKGHHA